MNNIGIWAVTPNGVRLAQRLARFFPRSALYLSAALDLFPEALPAERFERLATAVTRHFTRHDGHLFIMSTGIVVRMIAPLLQHKSVDPAVVVLDELGIHAVSLLAGHIGGANALARRAAEAVDAVPVITTATDLNRLPAVDTLACELGLAIENPDAVKHVGMAFLKGRPVRLHDPYGLIRNHLPPETLVPDTRTDDGEDVFPSGNPIPEGPGIYVDDRVVDLPPQVLILRPRSLAVGMGCNRDTEMSEMHRLLTETLDRHRLSLLSVSTLASVDIKRDETGLIALGESLGIPLVFFDREALGRVRTIATPSAMVEKHIGVKSVCEAAAILAARNGALIVPKQITPNVTAAVARRSSMSSVSAPGVRTTSVDGPTTFSSGSRPSPDTPPTST
ncbi:MULTISPECIES: cobalt-precorrin 5A hydrolase [Desulfococcus]|jgi:cobalt-precorrin 5A hydrolase|uniref:Cobalamin (Vitamin B12) biosynthesis CbiG protein n=1 Tax=Desulfococcus multivorans DSM 2059 TaxID=1121405 RepID=S7UTZ5_DESML|nr:cobalt-precorrin 5A hydrolase [Desulfococcus multivorans]AQV01970.1 hypothetical protein B2D07_15195 [Desulfococcus multivorans]EPR35803.1 cobalamin (vitamin B12) biosynthesis CbiG protein [Desulfococcus multivorans DSM 2059]MDX9817731.1 cobalt-precorrin 5A hydrolase [Desulfococcus multivorans]SJZ33470.1 cobalt-precorrin 5A acetaldehyde-lyase [Desulfococcus multivorans DSM 2059]